MFNGLLQPAHILELVLMGLTVYILFLLIRVLRKM